MYANKNKAVLSLVGTAEIPAHLLEQMPVTAGDWQAYKNSVQHFIAGLPATALIKTPLAGDSQIAPEWSIMLSQFKRAKCREYLGNHRRSLHTVPKILTPATTLALAASNLQARKTREPYFVHIAELYQTIQELEWALDQQYAGHDEASSQVTQNIIRKSNALRTKS